MYIYRGHCKLDDDDDDDVCIYIEGAVGECTWTTKTKVCLIGRS